MSSGVFRLPDREMKFIECRTGEGQLGTRFGIKAILNFQGLVQKRNGEGTARTPLFFPADRTMHSRAQMYTNLIIQNSNSRPTLNKYNSNKLNKISMKRPIKTEDYDEVSNNLAIILISKF